MAKTEFIGKQYLKFSQSVLDLLKKYDLITSDELVQAATIECGNDKVIVYLDKTRSKE